MNLSDSHIHLSISNRGRQWQAVGNLQKAGVEGGTYSSCFFSSPHTCSFPYLPVYLILCFLAAFHAITVAAWHLGPQTFLPFTGCTCCLPPATLLPACACLALPGETWPHLASPSPSGLGSGWTAALPLLCSVSLFLPLLFLQDSSSDYSYYSLPLCFDFAFFLVLISALHTSLRLGKRKRTVHAGDVKNISSPLFLSDLVVDSGPSPLK